MSVPTALRHALGELTQYRFYLCLVHLSTLLFPVTYYLRTGWFGREEGTFGANGVLGGTVRGAVAGGWAGAMVR
jgi:hypothetical protein